MNRDPLVLRTGDPVARALDLLIDNRLLALPIVDGEHRYRGMFLKSKLISLLLPLGAMVGESIHHISQVPGIGFLTLSTDDLRNAFAAVAQRPVEDFADPSTPVFRPDSPLSSALLQLYRTRNFLPVVEEGTDRLLGVISTWDILGTLRAARETSETTA